MVRALRWIAACAFVAAPILLFIGRPDRHMTVRLGVFAVGAVVALAMTFLASRRTSGGVAHHTAAAVWPYK